MRMMILLLAAFLINFLKAKVALLGFLLKTMTLKLAMPKKGGSCLRVY